MFPARSVPWLLPGTKSVSYATHVAAEAEARRRGADDAVLVDVDGTVLEGTVTNIWWREGDTLLTPELELGILAGETRAALLGLAPEEGFAVETGAFPLDRLLAAEEVFTSSSVREVMPVVAVDGRAFDEPPGGRGHAPRAPAPRCGLTAIRRGLSAPARYPPDMEKLRLGGMALQNGVLVHGPRTWGAAVRLPDGTIKTRLGAEAPTRPRRFRAGGARRAAAGRGVRGAAGDEARAARGAPPLRAPGVAVALVAASTERQPRAPLVASPRAARGGRGDGVARPGARRAAR